MVDSEYLSCAETAKLVRGALKKAFPGVKFSVRSDVYAGGASIRIGWTDGPTGRQVDAVIEPYKGSDFDGMIDMKVSRYAWLMPDGSAVEAGSRGTTGSAGTIPSSCGLQPSAKSRKVRFGADFIFTSRTASPGMVARALDKVARKWGFDAAAFPVVEGWNGAGRIEGARLIDNAGRELDELVREELARRTNYVKAAA